MHPEIARTLAKQRGDEMTRHAERQRTRSIARERHHHDPGPRGPRYRFHWPRGL